MAIREILTVPNPVLKQVSQPVDKVDDELRALMDDMLETMYAAPGIGLAAVQVGALDRVIVMDLGDRDGTVCETEEEDTPEAAEARRNPRFFANPEIGKLSKLHQYCHKNGMKTSMYYLRSKPASAAKKITVNNVNAVGKSTATVNQPNSDDDESVCLSCAA